MNERRQALERDPSQRWWWMLVIAALILAVIYVLAVLTPTGQHLENAALAGRQQTTTEMSREATQALGNITLTSLAVAGITIVGIGLVRRQFALTVAAVGVILGGQALTQLLKRFVLGRPDLSGALPGIRHNSFPSGHTTVAMTLMVAIFLIVPYRWRGVAMLIVLTWATSIGAYTITAGWHRFSDTLGADMVTLLMGAIASLYLAKTGRLRRATRRHPLRVVFVIVSAILGTVSLGLGLLLVITASQQPLSDEVIQWDLYLAAEALASASSVFTALWFWATWRRIDVVPAVRKAGRHES